MKKSTAILVIFILIVALLMSACTGGTNVSSTEPNVSSEIPSVTKKPTVNHNYPMEVEFVLDREVFIFKMTQDIIRLWVSIILNTSKHKKSRFTSSDYCIGSNPGLKYLTQKTKIENEYITENKVEGKL